MVALTLQGVWLSKSATPLERPGGACRTRAAHGRGSCDPAVACTADFGAGRSAYAAGDTAFLAALDDVETYESPTSTSSSNGMVEREFDNRTSLVVDPIDGQIPSASPVARARQAAVATGWAKKTGPEDLNNIHRCITTGVPRLAATSALVHTATTSSFRRRTMWSSSWRRFTTHGLFQWTGGLMWRRAFASGMAIREATGKVTRSS